MMILFLKLTNSLRIPSTMEHFLLHHAVQFLATARHMLYNSLPQKKPLLTSTWTAPSNFSKVCATELTLHSNKLCFHVYPTWWIWIQQTQFLHVYRIQAKIVKRRECGNSKGQLGYCYSQIILNQHIIFNFLCSKNLCIYLCTKVWD